MIVINYGEKDLLQEEINDRLNMLVDCDVVLEFINDSDLDKEVQFELEKVLFDYSTLLEDEITELRFELGRLN